MSSVIQLEDDRINRREWVGIEPFLAEIKTKPVRQRLYEHSGTTGKSGWFGTSSFEEAVTQAENGWPEGLQQIRTLYGSLKQIEGEKAERHVMRYAETGDEVDIGRFVSCEPDCMVDFDVMIVPATGRVVKLVASINASAGIEGRQLFLRGAAAVMLADLIDQSGLRSEIWLDSTGQNGSYGINWRMLLKSPDQHLELDRLAFSLASPSMLRRLMFRAYEISDPSLFNMYIGHGYTSPMNPKPERGTILVDCLQYGFGNNLTNETVPAFVQKMLDSLMEPKTV